MCLSVFNAFKIISCYKTDISTIMPSSYLSANVAKLVDALVLGTSW